jgi:hypothetical protein
MRMSCAATATTFKWKPYATKKSHRRRTYAEKVEQLNRGRDCVQAQVQA